MNAFTITSELCAEDRARIDRLTDALETRIKQVNDLVASGTAVYVENGPTEDAETPAEAPEVVAPQETQPEPEKPAKTEIENDAPTPEAEPTTEPEEPAVTLEQIQQKVVQLAAGNGGAKKAAVREIINAYGAKVSDLKDQPDKWGEVWKKLTALEG